MLPPTLPHASSASFHPSSLTVQQRTPTSAEFMNNPTAVATAATASPPHRLAHNISSPHLGHISPRLGHPSGVNRRPRANTDHNVRPRYQHNPYSNGTRRAGLYDYGHDTTTNINGGYNPINYTTSNNNSGSWIPDSAVISTSSSPNPFPDLSMEDRKPSLGLNGSPHPPPPTLLPGPPASPSLSSRSRDSPLSYYHHLSSGGEYSTHSSSANSVSYSPESGGHSLPTVPSSSSDLATLSQYATYSSPMSGAPSYHTTMSSMDTVLSNPPQTVQEYDEVIANLRNQLREMEFLRRQDQAKLAELQTGQEIEQQITRDVDAQFKASWKSRTESRIKTLCALNRAGNALCAWHDSRRERRQYPPRMAPAGVLNCGCTYEQALFEESLTRQGVGAYQPGESVRMDPALRNPLLALLQRRYGYKDGDFERVRTETPDGEETWIWPENDDAKAWSTGKAQIGNTGSGRRVAH